MQINNSVYEMLAVPIQWFKVVNALVYNHLGFWGQLAFDLLLLYLLVMIVLKVTKVVIRCVLFVALPSLVLSFVSSYFLPFSISVILPVCVVLMIAINVAMS
jgi:hypothetical protein